MPPEYKPLLFLPFTQAEMACETCGVRFLFPKAQLPVRRYCSQACYRADPAGRRATRRACPNCGQTYVVRDQKQFCSLACRYAYRARPEVLAARIWASLDRSGGPAACWPWKYKRSPRGYGQTIVAGRDVRAHRVAWEVTHGPIPAGMVVCHHCDNPPCCNPRHLFLGDALDNVHDKVAKKRHQVGERSHLAKLTEPDVVAILTALRDGTATKAELGRRYGVARGHIGKIAARVWWKHVSV